MNDIKVDLSKYNVERNCSLYRAICYIAYAEKPILEKIAEHAYRERININCESPLYYKKPNDEIYSESQKWTEFLPIYENELNLAAKVLRIKLITGEIIAEGVLQECSSPAWADVEYIENSAPQGEVFYKECPLHKKIIIQKKEWENNCSGEIKIDWGLNVLTHRYDSEALLGLEESRKYIDITLCTKSLYASFESINSDLEKPAAAQNKGRIPFPSWQKHVYPEIIKYFYEGNGFKSDGKLDSGENIANDIHDICSQKYPDIEIPSANSIRTEAINHILRRLKFEKN